MIVLLFNVNLQLSLLFIIDLIVQFITCLIELLAITNRIPFVSAYYFMKGRILCI